MYFYICRSLVFYYKIFYNELMTIKEAKIRGKTELSEGQSPVLDTEVFLKEILGCDKTYLLFHQDNKLTEDQEQKFLECLQKRKTGLPVAYILGKKEFFGYEFFVNPSVLIPKPDTELLVENALGVIKSKKSKKDIPLRICDMCTGSGCVGISLMKNLYECNFEPMPLLVMGDISQEALNVARKNAEYLLPDEVLKRISFVRTNLFEFASENDKFDLIVSNPPYVPKNQTDELLMDGRNEPRLALDGDVNPDGTPSNSCDGLEIIRFLIPQSAEYLKDGGILLIETGEYNAEATEDIMKLHSFTDTELSRDLEGQLRNVKGIFKN